MAKRKRRIIIGVIGDSIIQPGGDKEKLAVELGKTLVDNGYRVLTGGGGGVMRAVCRGAHMSSKYQDGDTIAILPMGDINEANPYSDIPIATNFGLARNFIIANSKAVIAIGGGSGTLNEMAAAWADNRCVIAYNNVKGWSANLAGTKIDNRQAYGGVDDLIWPVTNASEAIATLKKYLPMYTKYLDKISFEGRVILEEREPRFE